MINRNEPPIALGLMMFALGCSDAGPTGVLPVSQQYFSRRLPPFVGEERGGTVKLPTVHQANLALKGFELNRFEEVYRETVVTRDAAVVDRDAIGEFTGALWQRVARPEQSLRNGWSYSMGLTVEGNGTDLVRETTVARAAVDPPVRATAESNQAKIDVAALHALNKATEQVILVRVKLATFPFDRPFLPRSSAISESEYDSLFEARERAYAERSTEFQVLLDQLDPLLRRLNGTLVGSNAVTGWITVEMPPQTAGMLAED
jgi:hypothetical protein